MATPVRVDDVIVGLLTENTSRMLAQAIRLVRSIRWFGGEFAGVRVVACGVGPIEAGARETLEALGVEMRTVSRFHPGNPTANRHQLVAELLDAPQPLLFVLDCDTIVVRDPLPFLSAEGLQAKIAPGPTVSDAVFERLFAHFGLRKPPRSHVTSFTGEPTIPYFNAGVLAIPRSLARTLAPVWRKYNQILADHPELAAPCQKHVHQASLSLALAETGIPCVEMPNAMNFQINATHLAPPSGFAETDPVILHYHQLATDDGFLLPCPYPGAQARIEMFHERMRAEGFVQEEKRSGELESRPIVIAGMHRSGTSLVAQLVNAFGVYAGQPDDVAAPDIFNPTGYWEHKNAVEIDREILMALGADDVGDGDLARLPDGARADFAARAMRVAQSMQGRGPFLLKDPRMSLLFPLWKEVLGNPICVIAWRDPLTVARSLAHRDKKPLVHSLAVWEHYNRTILRDTEGVPRVLVSYEQLLADPFRVARDLHESLTGFGVRGLSVLTEERVRQVVHADFDRSGRRAQTLDERLLTPEQRALLESLRTGSALHATIEPTSVHTLELLAEFAGLKRKEELLRRRLAERDSFLKAIFESRTWRLAYGVTGLLRLLRREKSVSAEERWQKMQRERDE